MTNDILHHKENGVELFTIKATGESGMSQRGLARACGKRLFTIQNLIGNLTNGKAPKRLQSFVGKELNLTNEAIKKGGQAIVYQSKFCAAVIKHYAYSGSEIAQEFDAAIGEIGLTSYIQGKTGYLPEGYQSSKSERELLNLLILSRPEKRDIHFDDQWRKEAVRVTGYSWDGLPMARFIRKAVYDYFPSDLINRLEEVNPYYDGQRRCNKHYEHFEQNLDEEVLKKHIRDVLGVLAVSLSKESFWRNMNARFSRGIQTELSV